MEGYKGRYIEERWGGPHVPFECVVYEDEEKMTRGDYMQVFDSIDSAKNWIDMHPSEKYQLSLEIPEVEFEGPLGTFYSPSGVSMEALVKGAVEIVNAMINKGASPLDVVRMIREKGGQI